MKNLTLSLALCLICLGFFSCSKDSKEPDPVNQAPPCVTLSGYTYKDQVNAGNGIVDSTDWRLDDTWSACEQNLFAGTNFNTNCVIDDTLLTEASCYPNPTTDYFHIQMGTEVITSDTALANSIARHDSTIQMDLVVLDQHNLIMGEIHSNKYAQRFITYSLAHMYPPAGDTIFRVYYKLTDLNNCVRMGHGDIIRH